MITVYDIAKEFIQYTNCPVFITGKAGTGKTTMLRQIKEGTLKQTMIVAPTGVAAINAGGTTIHSLFQLPFSPFIPTPEGKRDLIVKQQVSEVRRKLFRELELLIIDEISMVRADMLDAIDTILRHYRYRRNEPFGGVQMVYIGDMYQLPPVCIGDEWSILHQYYKTPYFFNSQVVGEQPPIYIELDKIFRQSNLQFINLLNEVRNNSITPNTIALLNSLYRPDYKATDDGYITLTTHNATADTINNNELAKIKSKTYSYSAIIKGDFPEKIFPTEINLELKLGAKVMFIANDTAQPRRFFNGKIGKITDISDTEIWVECDDCDSPISVEPTVWENKSYTINKKENKIEEKLLGTFTQLPLRLAWAITIHKSQGLTFDRVIIDAGAAFASGQVYVALSRCRSLDGIIMTSPINPSSLAIDQNIVNYCQNKTALSDLAEQVKTHKNKYSINLLSKLFSLEELISPTIEFYNSICPITADFNEETKTYIEKLRDEVNGLYKVAIKFISQLNSFDVNSDIDIINKRIKAASKYYTSCLNDIITLINESPAVTESKTEAQFYVEHLKIVFENTHRIHSIISQIENDSSVTNYFAAKHNTSIPPFKVKAYAAEREVKMLKTENPILYKRLYSWRNTYCKENEIPIFMVCSNATLVELSNSLPLNRTQLLQIKGFGEKKADKFGDDCLGIISSYCNEFGLDTDTQTNIQFEQENPPEQTSDRQTTHKKTEEITLELLQQGLSINQVAEKRQYAISTIYHHTAQLIRNKRIDITPFIDAQTLKEVMSALEKNPAQSNNEIFQLFDGSISYNDISLIRAHQIASDERL